MASTKMLLFAYPGEFRLRFGTEMVTTFSDLISDEWEQNGRPGVARVHTRGSVFRRLAASTPKFNSGCDVAVAGFFVRVVFGDLLCNYACV